MNVNSDYESEIKSCKRLIVELLNRPDRDLLDEGQLRIQRDALQSLINDSEDSVESLLHTFIDAAPITFRLRWPKALPALQASGSNPKGALAHLGQLFGWAYIEAVWVAQVSGRQALEFGGAHFTVLAAVQMGLSEKLTEREVLSAVATQSTLIASLLMGRFEQSVNGGLEKISGLEVRIEAWERRLNESEERVNNTEEKISAYQAAIDKFKVTFGIAALSAAFRDFFKRKRTERNFWALLSVCLALVIVGIPVSEAAFYSIDSTFDGSLSGGKASLPASSQEREKEQKHEKAKIPGSAGAPASMVEESNVKWIGLLSRYLPIVGLEILLIYFFRISLMQFNTTKGQLLQLEMRIAVCEFIEEYVKFSKDNDKPDLSKFEAMIFSPVVSDAEKIPSTFDGLEQLEKLVAAARGK